METGLRAMQRVRSRAQVSDEPRRPDHGYENLGQELSILGDAEDVGRDADEFALRIVLYIAAVTPVDRPVHVQDRRRQAIRIDALGVPDDIGLGVLDEASPQQREGLRGAVADPSAIVIARPGLEGVSRRIDEDERGLRLDRVADFAIADLILRGPILSRQQADDLVAKRVEIHVRAGATPSRIGAETTNARLPPGASEKANSRPRSADPTPSANFAGLGGALLDEPGHVSLGEVGDRGGGRLTGKCRVRGVVDGDEPGLDRDRVDVGVAAVLPVRIDLDRTHRQNERSGLHPLRRD